jgi:GalNAc-alpha-(1->4)-GalNAc-alpha-(1->3)-diNAcBac-PP-undecaprenol alpha-1,4-N-acetyl-D-galactosaminyltransferase
MKFLLVIDNLNTGGAQRQLVSLATGLKGRGYIVEVFCYSSGELLAQTLYDMDIPIHQHIKRSRFSLDVVAFLHKLIDGGGYDLILSFLTTPNFYSILAGKILRFNPLPVIVSERSCDYPGWLSKGERLVRLLYIFVDHIIVNSTHQRLNLQAHYPAVESRFSTIYNGYDLNVFYPARNDPDNHPLKILVIASVSPYKNGMCLVEALKILRNDFSLFPEVDWIGQRVRMGYRLKALQEMEQKLQLYELENQWHWLDQRADIVDQLHRHDVLVHPSFVEGLPNVVCEALACARPVIVSNVLDHPYLVQDGQSGYLFDWKNPSDLAAKIKLFNELSCEERANMGRKGRQFAEAHLSVSRYVDQYEQLFIDILWMNNK